MYITRLASNEIFLPSYKIHQEVGRAKDLSAPRYKQRAASLPAPAISDVLFKRASGRLNL